MRNNSIYRISFYPPYFLEALYVYYEIKIKTYAI